MSDKGKALPSAQYLNECFEYAEGSLTWKTRPASHFRNNRISSMWNAKNAGIRAGRVMAGEYGYMQIGLDGKRYLAHRLIAALHGVDTSGVVDHISGDCRDNRIENLRGCSRQQNTMNNRGWRNKSTPLGVSLLKSGRFVAYIRANGKHKHLGQFQTLSEAEEARRNAELVYYEGFSRAQSTAYLAEVTA